MIKYLFRSVFATFGLLIVFGSFAGTASATEYTDLADAFDDLDDGDPDTYDAFDFNIEPKFEFDVGTGQIAREAPCVPSKAPYGPNSSGEAPSEPYVFNNPRLIVDPNRCPKESRTIFTREMGYRYTQSKMSLDLEAGLYKDLELHLSVPYVFSATSSLKYGAGSAGRAAVGPSSSSVDPSTERIQKHADNTFSEESSYAQTVRQLDVYNMQRFFALTSNYTGYTRQGMADPTLGLHWAPYNDARDDTKATLLFGLDYTMPLAPIKRADNKAVGEGMHKLDLTVASSKRFDWIAPYFGFNYMIPLLSGSSPIKSQYPLNEGQIYKRPPQKVRLQMGSEFVPYEQKSKGEKYSVDLRFLFGYTSNGRTYTPLYDHFANSRCNGKTVNDVLPKYQNGSVSNPDDVACSWILQRPANRSTDPAYDLSSMTEQQRRSDTFSTNGIMNAESYGVIGGRLGFNVQPFSRLQIKGGVNYTYQQKHILTNARLGTDLPNSKENNKDQAVDLVVSDREKQENLSPTDVELERNPYHNPAYDSPGQRFRLEGYGVWKFSLSAALKF